MEIIILQKPTPELTIRYIKEFQNPSEPKFSHYPYHEKAVLKIKNEFPDNKDIIDVLLKVGILNSFYNTNIFKPFSVAERILNLDIDERLNKGDESLIKEIADNNISGKNKNFYSFATKYCSMHNPECYPIYDSYIEWILKLYNKQYNFHDFKIEELKDYGRFKEILSKFKEFFGLENFSFKEIDQFLWAYAKEIKSMKTIKNETH